MIYTYNRIVLKKKGNLSHATTWINLEDLTLCEIRQTLKDKYFMIPLKIPGAEQGWR